MTRTAGMSSSGVERSPSPSAVRYDQWYYGVLLSVLASFVGGLGDNLVRYAHTPTDTRRIMAAGACDSERGGRLRCSIGGEPEEFRRVEHGAVLDGRGEHGADGLESCFC